MKNLIFYASFIIFIFSFLACNFALHDGEWLSGAYWAVPSLLSLISIFKKDKEDDV